MIKIGDSVMTDDNPACVMWLKTIYNLYISNCWVNNRIIEAEEYFNSLTDEIEFSEQDIRIILVFIKAFEMRFRQKQT
jgi:hypothetical protein